MDPDNFTSRRSCTTCCFYAGGNAFNPETVQKKSQRNCVNNPPCRKLGGVTSRLIHSVATAFFTSLQRCYCMFVDTKDDNSDDSNYLPLIFYEGRGGGDQAKSQKTWGIEEINRDGYVVNIE